MKKLPTPAIFSFVFSVVVIVTLIQLSNKYDLILIQWPEVGAEPSPSPFLSTPSGKCILIGTICAVINTLWMIIRSFRKK